MRRGPTDGVGVSLQCNFGLAEQTMPKRILIAGLVALLLNACGGGSSSDGAAPAISQIVAENLKYGQTANIYIAGKYMRSDMVASTGTCTNPSFSSSSTTESALLNCKVTATGPLPITIKAANGDVLFSSTLNVAQPEVTLFTSKGSIVLDLYPDVAPTTVNNFLAYVNSRYYANTLFHRVIAGFVIQGGGYTTGVVKKAGQTAPIALESNKGLSNTRGTVAMARTADPNSATSEFFINLVDNLNLNYQNANNPGYAVFGKVTSDLAVVDAIAAEPTGATGAFSDVPLTDVVIGLASQTR
jgi:cyclophilin family peptidyl-prolyl cis-trans isomerase